MFRIPDFFVDAPEFKDAVEIMTRHGRGDLLEGMKAMERVWEEHCAAQRIDMDANTDEDFFANWCWECNAFNVVFENMRKLF